MAIRIGPTNSFKLDNELSEYGKMLAYIKSYKDTGYSLYGLRELEKSNIDHKTRLLTTRMHTEDPKVLSEKIRFHQRVLDHLETLTEWKVEPEQEKRFMYNAITMINMIPTNAVMYTGKGIHKLWKNTNFKEWFKNKKSELKRKGFI